MNSQPEYQINWTYCLGELVKLWLKFCPAPVHLCSEFIMTRLGNITTDDPRLSNPSGTGDDVLFVWWRNYIVFATSAATKR